MTEPPNPPDRRRRPSLVAIAALLTVVALGVLVVIASQEDEEPISAPTTSTTIAATATVESAASTTSVAATTTTRAATTSTSPSSTTTAPAGPGFEPACTEQAASPSSDPGTPWPTDARLGPIGAAPSLVIGLPGQRVEYSADPQPVYSTVGPVPGGFLVTARAELGGSVVAVVELDGDVRWRRCLPTTPMVLSTPQGEYATLVEIDYSTSGERASVSSIALADGRRGPSPQSALDERVQLVAANDAGALFAHPAPHPIDESADRMALLDPATLEVVDVPYPPGTDGTDASLLFIERNWTTGDLVRLESQNGWNAATAVLVDGAWSTEESRRAAQTNGYFFNGDSGDPATDGWYLQYRDGLGRVGWERRDIVVPGGEGFASGITGDIVVAKGCRAPSALTCFDPGAEWTLYGLDLATGATVWERPGSFGVTLVADGKGLVIEVPEAGDGVWTMLDFTTGEPVADDQTWVDPSAFTAECCGGGDYVHVAAEGDVVVAWNYGRVSIWLPRDASTPTKQVSLL